MIEELKKYSDVTVVYVGRKTTQEGDPSLSAESKVLPKLGIKYVPITTGRLQREFTLYTIPSLLKIPIGFIQALYIIFKEKPNVVLSFGGYVAVPIVLASWLFSIPILVHEQTLVLGLANQISSFFANKKAISFKTEKVDGKTIVTGNPIRRMILESQESVKHPLTILITGGNQGSHTINLAVEEILGKLTKLASVIHVTGDNKFKDFKRLEKLQNKKYRVFKLIDENWGKILSNADLVVSRAGINTLTELAYLEKPALVIPFEPLYHDEQNKNAKFFERLGLVRILPQSKLSGKALIENLKYCLKHLDVLKQTAKQAKNSVIPDAAKRLALETILLA